MDATFAASILESRKFDELEAKFVVMLSDKSQLDAQWRSLDFNGNGIVSLAELDRWFLQSYPQLKQQGRAYQDVCQDHVQIW